MNGNWPDLGCVGVEVTTPDGTASRVPVFFVSPGQINAWRRGLPPVGRRKCSHSESMPTAQKVVSNIYQQGGASRAVAVHI